ncbi:hypothetical protein SynROS8604_00244 [Synechococcus sp. ROS8604]|nr:hypothetical protein SynROS8604_00244 [Synechococcus sp. ROS8604]
MRRRIIAIHEDSVLEDRSSLITASLTASRESLILDAAKYLISHENRLIF